MHAVEDLQKWRKSNRELSEHPDYPIESWVRAVDGGQTNLDYWDWMLTQASESDRRAQVAAAKAAEERTDQLMVEGNLFYFVNGSTDYAEVIRTAPFFVAPVIKGYDYSSGPFPLQIVTAANLCKAIEQSPRMEAGAILYGYGATSPEDANLILKRLRRYERESADGRRATERVRREDQRQLARQHWKRWWSEVEPVLGCLIYPAAIMAFMAVIFFALSWIAG